MAYRVNSDDCIACGACALECPQEAISPNEDDSAMVIDPDLCIDCGSCADTCPLNAISEE